MQVSRTITATAMTAGSGVIYGNRLTSTRLSAIARCADPEAGEPQPDPSVQHQGRGVGTPIRAQRHPRAGSPGSAAGRRMRSPRDSPRQQQPEPRERGHRPCAERPASADGEERVHRRNASRSASAGSFRATARLISGTTAGEGPSVRIIRCTVCAAAADACCRIRQSVSGGSPGSRASETFPRSRPHGQPWRIRPGDAHRLPIGS